MKLTDTACKKAKAESTQRKISDGGGLYLLIKPGSGKYWRLKYYFLGRERMMALGVYPVVSLADARKRREDAKKLLANGIDPATAKKERKREAIQNAANTFEAVGREWHTKQLERWDPKTGKKVMRYLENDIFPYIGSRPIADIDPPELLDALRKIEGRGAYYNAGRIRQLCGQIFRYGVATGKTPAIRPQTLEGR